MKLSKLETERFWNFIDKKSKDLMMIRQHHAEGVETTVHEDAVLEDLFVEYSRVCDPFESPTQPK